MIDYKAIGEKIRTKRKQCGLSQEALAERCNVGTTHISHIETGNCIPSLKVFISILNTLSCSADELLSGELTHIAHIHYSDMADLLQDCNNHELEIISNTVRALKASLRK